MSNGNQQDATNASLVSVSSGGESATWDVNARKAEDRADQNDDLTNIANRRVRPYFQAVRMRRVPGWW